MSNLVQQMTAKYRELAPVLQGFLLRLGCPPHRVEDIVQDAFYRALRYQAAPLGHIRNMRPWLYRTAYNLYIDFRRRERESATVKELADSSGNPIDMVVEREQVEIAMAALANVPERQRLAVLLCDVSGLTYAEAAEVLETTTPTIRGLLYRGRMRLREEYRNLEGGGSTHEG